MVRLQRYEDTYVGTAFSSVEDIRFDGFVTEIRYRRNGFSASIGQRSLALSRRSVRRSDLETSGAAGWDGTLGGMLVSAFASLRRTICTHTEGSAAFDPSFHLFEGGVGSGGTMGGGLAWRLGVFGGAHSVAGSYLGGEAGVRRGDGRALSISLLASRRLRVPSAQELFQPEITGDTTLTIGSVPTSGDESLSAEITDEISVGGTAAGMVSLDLFARRETSRIVLVGDTPAVYSGEGTGTVLGFRGRVTRKGTVLGLRCNATADFEFFGERSGHTGGVPEYRCRGGIDLERAVFKKTETIGIRLSVEAVGERAWGRMVLGSYVTSTVSASMTILGATIKVQMNNLFDTSYETYPGFRMPERHYMMGVIWEFLD